MNAVLSLSALYPAALTELELIHQIETDPAATLREQDIAERARDLIEDHEQLDRASKSAAEALDKNVRALRRLYNKVKALAEDEMVPEESGIELYRLLDKLDEITDDIEEIELPGLDT